MNASVITSNALFKTKQALVGFSSVFVFSNSPINLPLIFVNFFDNCTRFHFFNVRMRLSFMLRGKYFIFFILKKQLALSSCCLFKSRI